METTPARWRRDEFYGFPPGRDYVLLPRRPAGAAASGLVLYDPSLAHQRLASFGGRVLLRLRLGRVLPVRHLPLLPDPNWWQRWLDAVAEPAVGPVAAAAFRAGHARSGNPPRTTALLVAGSGEPIAFAKLAEAATTGSRLGVEALGLVTGGGVFRVPRLVSAGTFAGTEYLLQEPMPPRHAGAGRRPDLVAAVVDDVQQRLASLSRPNGTPGHHVPVHTAVSPGNLRLDRDGTPWLIDWDKAGWGPALTDDLRYWLALYARRPGRLDRRAAQVLGLLAGRGSPDQIREALAWRIAFRPEEPDRPQQRMRDAVARRLGAG